MGIKADTDIEKLIQGIQGNLDTLVDASIEAMRAACWNVVANARQISTYQDQTGNLRSSIGFVIYDKGSKVFENFEAHGKTESGTDGMTKAKNLADNVAHEYGDQIVAVCVAGEDYAVYVESRGLDVITGSWQQYERLFTQYYTAALNALK